MTKLYINLLLGALLAASEVCYADSHPVMNSSSQKKQERFEKSKNLPHIENVTRIMSSGSVDLIPLVPYIGKSRNQGDCGNCWVWAGTTIMEVALNVQKSIKKRLSVQYLNSNFNKGGTVKTRYSSDTESFACDGGTEADFAKFYRGSEGKKKLIPWSNKNASFADANGGRKGGYHGGKKTNRPASSIKVSPAYSLSTVSAAIIQTYGIGEAQAIANIKAAIDSNIAVEFDFYLPNEAAWNDLYDFWDNYDETALFNFDKYSGVPYDEKTGGAHATVLVGYDDTDPDPANHYWKILNSWGNTFLRPQGVFRIPMHMNYDNNDGTASGQNIYFEEILPIFK